MSFREIPHEAAMLALAAGVEKAKELSQRSSLSIVDKGGNLLGFVRVEDGAFGTIEVATSKAFTAAAFRFPSDHWMKLVQPGEGLYGLDRSGTRPYVVFGGGMPVFDGETVIGGVGVSGGPTEADEAIAHAMVDAIARSMKVGKDS
ncbi:heme-binding protein [Paraburkholderia dipogonis]|uniref:Heme-binding protein n=1 Tax=Paraburkholderia dipogonis TaxID=1211383 RepID=A0A4Y8MIW7_9BURK|nr:heme-binding protein [Paraburkholderia dipogonis]TFE37389.1 heme-binding protein [Paraburkholderia dipogonis]